MNIKLEDVKSLSFKQIAAVVATGSVVGLISGCSQFWVKHDVPQGAVTVGFPEKVSVAESPMYRDEFDRWQLGVKDTWDARFDAASSKVDIINGVAGALVQPENLAALGFNPYGGAGASFILLVNMVLGQRKLRTEKEDSYNAGLVKGQEVTDGSNQS